MSTICPEVTGRKRGEPKARSGKLAMSIAQFCDQHSISEAFYYELRKKGKAPDTMEVEGRVLISNEAAARWRAEREHAAAQEV